jgi:acyl carrier protein
MEVMIDYHFEVVRCAVAFHLRIDPETIAPTDRLEGDLGLDPLDLVLVVLRLEELALVELPVADLEYVETVDDLVVIVRSWCPKPFPVVAA